MAGLRRGAIRRRTHSVAFVHIPKTGGEAVRSALLTQRLDRKILLTGHRNDLGKHSTGTEILIDVPTIRCIFLVARDPIDRLFSLYNHLRRWSWDARYSGRLPNPQISAAFASCVPFDDFCHRFISGELASADTHLRPGTSNIFLKQSQFINGVSPEVEVIKLRFSNLAADLQEFISERFSVKLTDLEVTNESRSGVLALDGGTRAMLEEFFAEDYEAFSF